MIGDLQRQLMLKHDGRNDEQLGMVNVESVVVVTIGFGYLLVLFQTNVVPS